MKLGETSRVLDLACGAGRWLDVMPENIALYRGIDFSSGMIDIARANNSRTNAQFFTGPVLEAENILPKDECGTFNRVLIIASLMYMNDSGILSLFGSLDSLMTRQNVVICIKVSIGTEARLTLKDFYSEELKSDYNAIYRTRAEYLEFFSQTLIPAGFALTDEGFMFDESLNNRKETVQYYFILER